MQEAPPQVSWALDIDLAFADRRFGPDTVNRCLAEARSYPEPPRLDAAGLLHARIRREAGEGARPAAAEVPQKVAVRVRGGKDIEFACSCPRGSHYLCEHATAVLVDLAAHARLRAALAAGVPAEEALGGLPSARRAALEERTIDERIARWLPARLDDDLEVDVEIVRLAGAGAPGAEDTPGVLLRVRRPPSRTPLNPRELLAARVAPRHRRLLELSAPSRLHRDALVATRAQASLLLDLLRADPGVQGAPGKRRLRFSAEAVAPRVDVDGERLVARWCAEGGRVVCDAADALLFAGPSPYLWCEPEEILHRVAPGVDLDVASGLCAVPSLPLTPAVAERVGRVLLARGRGAGVGLPPPEAFGLPPLEAPSFALRLSGSPLDLRGQLSATYGAATFALGPRAPTADTATSGGASASRNFEAEERAIEVLRVAGLAGPDAEGFGASEDGAVDFWRRGIAVVRESREPAIEVLLAPALASVRVGPPVRAQIRVGAASGWLDTQLDFTAASLKIEMAALHATLAADRRWLALSDGTLARITDDVAELVGEAASLVDGAGHARLAPHHVGRVERWVDRFGGEVDEAVASLRAKLRALDVRADPELPSDLNATLRPYQRRAVAWLQFLRELGAGGILADDMGLGKTVVTLAFLAQWTREGGAGPSLVVCPTSVVGNWLSEAKRFTPGLRCAVWRGARRRDLRQTLSEHDLVVTSYGLLRRHVDDLAGARFRAAVFDEAQNLKNAASETSRAARRVGAAMHLALTGTPIENRLGELWSIMSLVNPGLLGSEAHFEDRFERPVAARPDGPAAEQLRTLVRPFVLRRTKAQVLVDLPPKTEIERACVLGAKQKRLYDALALTLRQAVKKDIEKRGMARSRLSVLTAILRLRQMACDPRLVDPTVVSPVAAKREAFVELVRELAAEGRRALVFSQFVSLFTLWREDLDRERIAYEYLDGSTTDRDAVVERFQRGSAPLFLVSLKAGGAGLNLTAADTVIHCDPWWNPAVEDQATDRAHRMGQQRPVTVIRLVAQGTIEEKIGLLKGRKRELAAVIGAVREGDLQADGEGSAPLAGLTEEDVDRLLGGAGSSQAAGDDVRATDVTGTPGHAPGPPPNLTAREIDELRGMVRWLDRTGIPARELARKVGVPASRLSLLLVGHRVRIARAAAERIRSLYDARRPVPGDR